jgi:hypothetical protein
MDPLRPPLGHLPTDVFGEPIAQRREAGFTPVPQIRDNPPAFMKALEVEFVQVAQETVASRPTRDRVLQ